MRDSDSGEANASLAYGPGGEEGACQQTNENILPPAVY